MLRDTRRRKQEGEREKERQRERKKEKGREREEKKEKKRERERGRILATSAFFQGDNDMHVCVRFSLYIVAAARRVCKQRPSLFFRLSIPLMKCACQKRKKRERKEKRRKGRSLPLCSFFPFAACWSF